MSGKANNRLVRVFSFGNSYVISSDFVKHEKLQIRFTDSGSLCINRINLDEWESMSKSVKTNSVSSPSMGTVFVGYGCLGILSLPNEMPQYQQSKEQNDTLSYLVFVKEASSVGNVRTFDMMRISDVYMLSLNEIGSNNYAYNQGQQYQTSGGGGSNSNMNSLNEIKKLLCSGTFYFATSYDPNTSFDLTLSCQARYLNQPTNKKFLWNYNMHIPFRRLNIDTDQWLLKIICGFVEIRKVICENRLFKAALFSRLSSDRVGTRFQCRGVNDSGHCANFVETEQVVFSTDPATSCEEEFSFIQLRGSVPVFFEQPGVQVGSHRIKISRSMEACYPAFERHLVSIIRDYGPNIFVLNLLGTKGDETELTSALRALCASSPFHHKQQLIYTNFDYHTEMKLNKSSKSKVWERLTSKFYDENFNGAFFYTRIASGSADNDSGFESSSITGGYPSPQPPSQYQQSVTRLQRNFVRTNCMDCLDRTNSVQSFIAAEEMVWHQLKTVIREHEYRRFRDVFLSMWVLSGDHISKIYAGTGAIQGRSVTQDFTRSLGRALQNNLFDDSKNDSMELYLNSPHSPSRSYGELDDFIYNLTSKSFLRLPFSVLRDLIYNKREYVEPHQCRIAVGTWNVNGGFSDGDMRRVNLADWLVHAPSLARRSGFGYLDPSVEAGVAVGEIDMFVIGFEEIVDLSAQNIISASEENATIWRKKISEFLGQQGDYVELIYENLQLVGVCLFVFVLRKHVGAIRDVSVAKTKTGLGGTAGNKGGVLLRFVYYNTSICFVCSHFAAHQKEIKQRNEDFRQIYEQSQFIGGAYGSRPKLTTRNHDYVFWCGDLNYRIDMPNDRCRSLISQNRWDELLELDQLTVQRHEGNVFKEFYEAPISFPPTYKYNVLEDTYDRSEKCRVPAWTDRVLWRRRPNLVDKKADIGKCLYYGRTDMRYSDHRPVSALFEIEIDKTNPTKLVETLNKAFLSTRGSFQVVLVVTTHTNCMNEVVRNAVVKLFSCFPSYCFTREYKNCLYITYADGKHGYEAFAQLNNYHLDSFDLQIQVRVENEQNYAYLFEEEIKDCINSLSYFDNNLRKTSIAEVKVADLLGDDTFSSEAYLNIPSELHTDLNHLIRLSPSPTPNDSLSPESVSGRSRSPMVKALSNSNLSSMFDLNNAIVQQQKFVHSEVDLLGLNTHHEALHQHSSRTTAAPPRRPPPPSSYNLAAPNEDKLIDILDDEPETNESAPVSFGFEDDFSKLTTNDLVLSVPPRPPVVQPVSNKAQTPPPLPPPPATKQPFIPARPVPPPPVPTPPNQLNKNPVNPLFSLFEDSFDPVTTSQSQPPPLPTPLKSSAFTATARPPPLPPMPPVTKPANPNQALLEEIFEGSARPASVPPPLPALPKVPPRPAPQPNRSSQIDPFAPINQVPAGSANNPKSLFESDFDPFASNPAPPPPLPPPRDNHFK